ncbi:MAG: hypothetical protein WDO15_18870 [Bacteroidota bacterium]
MRSASPKPSSTSAHINFRNFLRARNLDYEARTVIRREISAAGKSRAFINDTPVTLDVPPKDHVAADGRHSQHETLELGSRSFQLNLIDAYAGNQKLLEQYEAQWLAYTTASQEYQILVAESNALKQEADFVKFQLDELVKASFIEGEQESLESDLKIQEHAEEIKGKLIHVIKALGTSEYSVSTLLGDIRNQLNTISAYSASYQALHKRVESLKIELDDISKRSKVKTRM